MRAMWYLAGLTFALCAIAVAAEANTANDDVVFIHPGFTTFNVGANDDPHTGLASASSGSFVGALNPRTWTMAYDSSTSSVKLSVLGPDCNPAPTATPLPDNLQYNTIDAGSVVSAPAAQVLVVCEPNHAPQVFIEAIPGSGRVLQNIQFMDRTHDPDQDVTPLTYRDPLNKAATWVWDFGDGITSNLQNPVHSYDTPGYYNVTLYACDYYGACASSGPRTVPISAAPRPDRVCEPGKACEYPTVDAGKDFEADEDTVVSLEAKATGPTPPFTYAWRQLRGPRDPQVDLTDVFTARPTFTAPHLPDGKPMYLTFGVIASHESLDSIEDFVTVTITTPNKLPTITIDNFGTPLGHAVEGTRVTLNATRTFDADNDELAYRWEIVGGIQMPLYNATSPVVSFLAPPYKAGATMQVRLSVNDGRATANKTVTVTIDELRGSLGNATFTTAKLTTYGLRFNTNATGDVVWDFGDGTAGAVGSQVNHTFPKAGTYNVRMIANSPQGVRIARQTLTLAAPATSSGSSSTTNDSLSGAPAQFPWLMVALATFAVAAVAVGLFVALRARRKD